MKKPLQRIAATLDEEIPSDRTRVAMYALVHLRAKEYTSKIAKFLDDKYRRGHAAKALALLGAREYASRIAAFLDEDDEWLDQNAALLALGILEANEYAPKAARLMREETDSSVSNYAQESLILMGANDFLKEAASHFELPKAEEYIDVGNFDPLVDEEARAIHKKFVTRLKEIKNAR